MSKKTKKETGFEYEVKVYPVSKKVTKETLGILANASVTINESLVIGDIVIRQSNKDGSLYVLFPSRGYKDKDGKQQYKNIVFPCTSEARQEIVEAILEAYEESE